MADDPPVPVQQIASKFYASQEEEVVEDTFRSVLLRAGAFDRCYFDNGSQYVAKQLKLSLAKLGISISHAPVRSGKSKGYDKISIM